jgi:hypothetical protein
MIRRNKDRHILTKIHIVPFLYDIQRHTTCVSTMLFISPTNNSHWHSQHEGRHKLINLEPVNTQLSHKLKNIDHYLALDY